MVGRGFFRLMLRICLIALALCPYGVALATQADEDAGLHLYVYVENGAALSEHAAFPGFVTDALISMEMMRPDSPPMSLSIFTLPKRSDDESGIQAMPPTQLTAQALETLSQVMRDLPTVKTTDKNREKMRANGLKTAYEALFGDPSNNKRLLIFSTDDWSSQYNGILTNEDIPVLFVRVFASAEPAVPVERSWIKGFAQASLQTRDVPEWAAKCYPFLFGEAETSVRRYVASTQDGAGAMPAYAPQLAERKLLVYLQGAGGQAADRGEPISSDGLLRMVTATSPDTWPYGDLTLPVGDTALLVDRFEPYRIRYLADEAAMSAARSTNVPMRFVCQVERTAPSDLPLLEDWQLSLTAVNKTGGASIQADMTQNATTGQYVGEITFPASGEYAITFQATSPLGVSIAGEGGTVQVINPSPEVTGQNDRLNVWRNSPVELALPSIDLTTVFSDDDPAALRFTLEQSMAGIGIVDGKRLQADASLLNVSRAILTVTATDAEEHMGKAFITVAPIDVAALMKNGKASVTTTAQALYKGDPLPLAGAFTLGSDGAAYLDALAAEGKTDAFLALFQGAFEISQDGQALAQLEAKPALEADQLVFRSNYAPSPIIGEIEARLNVSWASGGGTEQVSSPSLAVLVINKAPVCLQPKVEFSVVLPDILSKGDPAEDYTYDHTYRLKDFVGTEPGDVLDFLVNAYGAQMTLYRQSNLAYVLTDQSVVADSAQVIHGGGITWDITQPSPTLTIRFTKRCDANIVLHVWDNDGAQIDSPIVYAGQARFENEATLILMLSIIAGLFALLVAGLIVRQVTKPAFLDTAFEVRLDQHGAAYRLPVRAWKKRTLTLRDMIQYLGLPITGQVSMRQCQQITFTPARRSQVALHRGRSVHCAISINGATLNPRQSKLRLSPDDAAIFDLEGVLLYITLKVQ